MLYSMFRRFAAFSKFDNEEEKGRTAVLLHKIILAISLSAIIYSLVILIKIPTQIHRVPIVFIILLGVCGFEYLLRLGYVKGASVGTSLFLWGIMVFSAATSAGVYTPGFNGLIVTILIAGLLLGGNAAIMFALLSIAAGFIMIVASKSGIIDPGSAGYSPISWWLLQSVFFVMSAVILNLAMTSLNRALGRIHESEQALAQNNQSLKQHNELLETIFEHIPVMIDLYDVNGRLQLVNQHWEDVMGWSRKEALQRDMLAELYPDSQKYQEVVEAIREPYSGWQDFRQQTRDGRFIETSWTNVKLSDGRTIGFGQDVTLRKQAEIDLQESEARLRLILENMPVMMTAYDEAETLLFWNKECERVTGYSAAEMVGKPLGMSLIYPDAAYREEMKQKWLQIGNDYYDWEWTLITKDGESKTIAWFSISEQVSIPGWKSWGVGINVTGRNQALAALRQSEENLDRIFQASPIAIIISTFEDGRYLNVNNQFTKNTGYSRDEVIGKTAVELEIWISPQDRDRFIQSLNQYGYISNYETPFRHRSGEIGIALMDSEMIELDGQVCVLSMTRDITDRKQMEDQLRQSLAVAQESQQQIEMLHASNLALTRSLDLDVVLSTLFTHLEQLISYDSANIVLKNSEHTAAVFAIRGHEKWSGIEATDLLNFDKGSNLMIRSVLVDQNTLLINDTRIHPHGELHKGAEHVLSWLGVPLLAGGKSIGLFSLDKAETDFFTPKHVRFAKELAPQAAVAIQNAMLFAEEQASRQQAETLRTLVAALTSSLNIEQVLALILNELEKVISFDSTAIFLLLDKNLRVVASRGFSKNVEGFTVPLANPLLIEMQKTHHPIILDNVQTDSRFEYWPGTESVVGWMGIPLLAQDELIGFMTLDSRIARAYNTSHITLVMPFANQAAQAIVNARLHEQVQQYAAELEVRVIERTAQLAKQFKRQAALAEIELAVNQPKELQKTLDQIVLVVTRLLPADGGGSIILWDAEQQEFYISSTSVKGQDLQTPTYRVRRSGGASRWIIENRKPFFVANIKDDPFGANQLLYDYGNQAYVGVPLLIEDEAIGVLYALDKEVRHYSEDDVNFLTALANRAAVAITKVRLYEQAQSLATQEERQRLARDLHDVVSQSLFSASVIAETLPRLWEKNPEAVRNGLSELHLLTRGTLAEMRTLLLELRPAGLENVGLDDLLRQLANALRGRMQCQVDLTLETVQKLPNDAHIAFYRIAQEAFNNISRHARADHVWVRLVQQDLVTILSIGDNGRGFIVDQIPSAHLGVGIMQERAKAVNANLSIQSQPGSGTEVAVSWVEPLHE
jgi:PAS domain S-box-containing protein